MSSSPSVPHSTAAAPGTGTGAPPGTGIGALNGTGGIPGTGTTDGTGDVPGTGTLDGTGGAPTTGTPDGTGGVPGTGAGPLALPPPSSCLAPVVTVKMVWAETYLVGCGYAYYKDPSLGFTKIYVCNYAPGYVVPPAGAFLLTHTHTHI